MLRWILINVVLVVAVWLALLLLTAAAGDVVNYVRTVIPPADDRAALPNYPDKEQARRMYGDFKQTVEDYVPFLAWRRLPMTTENVNIGEDGFRLHRRGDAHGRLLRGLDDVGDRGAR